MVHIAYYIYIEYAICTILQILLHSITACTRTAQYAAESATGLLVLFLSPQDCQMGALGGEDVFVVFFSFFGVDFFLSFCFCPPRWVDVAEMRLLKRPEWMIGHGLSFLSYAKLYRSVYIRVGDE